MKEAVKQISERYRLELKEEEIQRIAKQVEDADALFQQLFSDGIDGVMPLPMVSRKPVKR
jgi:Asp-tRNA(Asn)/Glu-tRNA(Gln) amidotransferase C subunit